MKVINLASSSSGNCYYVEFNNGATLLLEAGIPVAKIKKGLFENGVNLANVDACLITHNHKDHSISAYSLITSEFIKVWGNSTICEKINLLEPLKSKWITSKMHVIAFEVEHDAPQSFGFVIQAGDENLLFVNDCKYFKADLSAILFDVIMIECNYEAKLVHTLHSEAVKSNDQPMIRRYERLLNSHMNERSCLKILKSLKLNKCKAIFLMHLSDRHCNKFNLKKLFTKELNKQVFVCEKNGGVL